MKRALNAALSLLVIVACSAQLAIADGHCKPSAAHPGAKLPADCNVSAAPAIPSEDSRPAFTPRPFDDLLKPPEHVKVDEQRITDRVNFDAVNAAQANKDQCTAGFLKNRKMTDYYTDFHFSHQADMQKVTRYKELKAKVKAYLKANKTARGTAHYKYTPDEAKVARDYREFTDRINDFITLEIRRHCLQQSLAEYENAINGSETQLVQLAKDVNQITGTFLYRHAPRVIGYKEDEVKIDQTAQSKIEMNKRVAEHEISVTEKWIKSYDAEIEAEAKRQGFWYTPKDWKPAKERAGQAD